MQIDGSNLFTLHLAVTPLASGPSSGPSASSIPHTAHGVSTSDGQQGGLQGGHTSFTTGQPPPQQVNGTLPFGQAPNAGQLPQNIQFQAHFTFPPGQMPSHMQEAISNQMQQIINRQVVSQLPNMIAQQLQPGNTPGHEEVPTGGEGNHPNLTWQQLQAQQQRVRAAAGQNGINDRAATPQTTRSDGSQTMAGSTSNNTSSSNIQNQNHHLPHHHHHHHPHGPQPNQNTMQRTTTPNGEHVRVVFQGTSTITSPRHTPQNGSPFPPPPPGMPAPFPPTIPGFAGPFPQFPGMPQPFPVPQPFPMMQPNLHPFPAMAPFPRIPSPRPQDPTPMLYLRFQQQLAALEAMLGQGQVPPQQQIDHARAALSAIPVIHNFSTQGLQLHLDRIARQAQELRNRPPPFSSNTTQEATSGTSNTGTQSSATSIPTTVYLLSSPSGPHALLMSPTGGVFTTPNHPAQTSALPGLLPLQPLIPTPTTQPQPPSSTQASPPAGLPTPPQNPPPTQPANAQALAQQQPQHHHHHHHHNHNHNNDQQHVQQQQAQPNPGNRPQNGWDILVALGGHVWLFIRLFGFIYFFAAGMGLRRATLLAVGAFILFVLQTGTLRPWLANIWDPVRRHIEGLLPVPAVPPAAQPAAAPAMQGNNANSEVPNGGTNSSGPPAASTSSTSGVSHPQRSNASAPTPEEAAARLLAERQHPYFALFRDYVRRLERGVALFIGSLVPGFGERHIDARNAAEAAIAAAERRRVELVEEEEARRRREGEGQGEGGGDGSGGGSGGVTTTAAEISEDRGQGDGGEMGGDQEGLRRRAVPVAG